MEAQHASLSGVALSMNQSDISSPVLTREALLDGLHKHVESLPGTIALWEGGSAAFGRADRWSDLDLAIAVEDDAVESTIAAVDAFLSEIGTIALRWRVPDPTWHGSSQVFYQLAETDPHHLLDISFIHRSARDHFLQRELHGEPIVLFDRDNFTAPPPFDADAHSAGIERRRNEMRSTFPLFSLFVEKELKRGRGIDALAFYTGSTIRPLAELLRMKHAPHHSGFGLRYLHDELPREVADRLERLAYAGNRDELLEKQREAQAWIRELLDETVESLPSLP